MQKVTRYEIRHYPSPAAYSKPIFRQIVGRERAKKIVKRLRRSGYDAFADRMIVNLSDRQAKKSA